MKLATTAISLLSFGAFSKVVQATCADQAVFENCLQSGKVALAACTYSDWSCKCAAEKVIHTCYNDCSDDPELVAEAEVQEAVQDLCIPLLRL
ncbi:hypothetical protein K7432_015836 [Basidiobolus ranarum]|uniref:Extracellular membrane protein CFEM domain-containing protein n=1 Tax=Basidiobolus ranarum TaxID=34480 RepID=A0ABR2VMI0_9FUNG